MNRREHILHILEESASPIKGEDLGAMLDVTRQVIVQDIAILRAEGISIIATNRGYILPKEEEGLIKKIISEHETDEQMEDELNTIVDCGGIVQDVIIDHPVYGEIRGSLEIANRLDVKEFIKEVKKSKAEPLSKLTEGVHMHTIRVENEDMFNNIKKSLDTKKYLTK